ncbi:hypothetical protein AUJ66_01125 [Candidatus Desantisbacteria bacterium CG1_02_38_46]|uniref:Amidohydrolase-related domain-containing protein n=2 Tax=unclassified Candidatus Desantisiibacteriota TaxID=3106372 RepID=A0A1J4SJV2_9BACT|nr:MAG: hypothetical protein AUJ66_01125 [Candidatus Desantisbacteria bacterium CG1_02_38_46]PIU51530.1 MAG: hypothetical protein COS91_03905 [Candidatus Desantisbacteria bacterium CG07_land_8_20_14_0_80_39_15]
MIDDHTHIGRGVTKGEPVIDEKELLSRMDELGIEKAVVLPRGVSPECSFFHFETEDVLEVFKQHPDRIIPFCKLDPRNGGNSPETDFSCLLEKYKSAGCKGAGEITANLYIDDPLCKNLFHHCGKVGLPVLFHLAVGVTYGIYGLADDIGLPRLEKVLQEFPDTIFIGHAMAFWSEISADVNEKTRGVYPPGEVKLPGKLQELLKKYPNLYGDLSAGSGYNAISRDLNYGYKFLEEFQNKLLFGTDICHVGQEAPIVDYFRQGLKEGKISKIVYDKTTEENAKRVLGLAVDP